MNETEGTSEKNRQLRMKDLSRATGVSSGTIRYYVKIGVLPKPYKTYKNMAYYDESYIERIRLIKELQEKRFLPLNIIKIMLEGRDINFSSDEMSLFKEIDKPLFKDNSVNDGVIGPLTRDELVRHSGLLVPEIEKLEAIGMIAPDEQGRFDRECVRLAELVGELRRIGLTEEWDFHIEHLQTHMDLTEFLARKEIELFTKRIAGKGLRSEEISKFINDSVNAINSILSILHKRLIRKITEQLS